MLHRPFPYTKYPECARYVCGDYGEVEKNNIELKYPEPSSSQNIMEICICLPLLLISCTRINVIWLHCMKYATVTLYERNIPHG